MLYRKKSGGKQKALCARHPIHGCSLKECVQGEEIFGLANSQ